MPVSPSRARRLAQERRKLLEMIDEVIVRAYGKTEQPPPSVVVHIGQEHFENEELTRFLQETYEKSGWNVSFDLDQSETGGYCLVLKEKPL